MAEDVRIDTSKIEVVSAKDNNKLLKDIAEVVDSTNPFVAKGQSKTLKDGSNYYLLTDPKYNWYKEVAQDCFAYKDGTTTKTEKISAKGYRPDISKVRYSQSFNKGVASQFILERKSDGYLYINSTRVEGSNNKFAFYLLLQGSGGDGGRCGNINSRGGGGGGSGGSAVLGVKIDENYVGEIATISVEPCGIITLSNSKEVNSSNQPVPIAVASAGRAGLDQNGILGPLITIAVTALCLFVPVVGPVIFGITAVGVGIAGTVTTVQDILNSQKESDGGIIVTANEFSNNGVYKFKRIGVEMWLVAATPGSKGGGSHSAGSNLTTKKFTDNPEGVESKLGNFKGGSAGNNRKPLFVTYHGGGGGGASMFSNGGNGANATNQNGDSAGKGAGAGGGSAGWGSSSGGTGGSAYMEIRF